MGWSIIERNENSKYPKRAWPHSVANQEDTQLHPMRRQAALGRGSRAEQRLHGLLPTHSAGDRDGVVVGRASARQWGEKIVGLKADPPPTDPDGIHRAARGRRDPARCTARAMTARPPRPMSGPRADGHIWWEARPRADLHRGGGAASTIGPKIAAGAPLPPGMAMLLVGGPPSGRWSRRGAGQRSRRGAAPTGMPLPPGRPIQRGRFTGGRPALGPMVAAMRRKIAAGAPLPQGCRSHQVGQSQEVNSPVGGPPRAEGHIWWEARLGPMDMARPNRAGGGAPTIGPKIAARAPLPQGCRFHQVGRSQEVNSPVGGPPSGRWSYLVGGPPRAEGHFLWEARPRADIHRGEGGAPTIGPKIAAGAPLPPGMAMLLVGGPPSGRWSRRCAGRSRRGRRSHRDAAPTRSANPKR
jgi:hypothetical protein